MSVVVVLATDEAVSGTAGGRNKTTLTGVDGWKDDVAIGIR